MDIAKRHVRAIYFYQRSNKVKKLTTYRYDVCHDGKGIPIYITKHANKNYYATLGLKQPLFIRRGETIKLSKKEQRDLMSAVSVVRFTERKMSDDKCSTS